MKCERLFDKDAYMREFSAKVLSSEATDGGYLTVLDATAFFPEEGGQSCDTGTLGSAAVLEVFERNGEIYHLTDLPFKAGDVVTGKIDFEERYRKMQNHTGEHILCGVAHRLYGAENVGFHLSDEYVRVDLDVYLDHEKVSRLEREANEAALTNAEITAWYPGKEELSALDFRCKDGITGDVRLVKIEGVDLCACCAPHVATSAEVGMIKVVDHAKYKSGTRLEIVCGSDAAKMFIDEHAMLSQLASSYSVARSDLPSAIEKQKEELRDTTYRLRRAERDLMAKELETISATDGDLLFFYDGADAENVREFLNGAASKCRIAAGFIGNDEDGYTYIIRSDRSDLKTLSQEINAAIGGRGGGSAEMIRGKCTASKNKIEEYFK